MLSKNDSNKRPDFETFMGQLYYSVEATSILMVACFYPLHPRWIISTRNMNTWYLFTSPYEWKILKSLWCLVGYLMHKFREVHQVSLRPRLLCMYLECWKDCFRVANNTSTENPYWYLTFKAVHKHSQGLRMRVGLNGTQYGIVLHV